jgi:hypothetical protein
MTSHKPAFSGCNRPFCDGRHIGQGRDSARCHSRRPGIPRAQPRGRLIMMAMITFRPVRGCTRIAGINRGANEPGDRRRAKRSVNCRSMGYLLRPHRLESPGLANPRGSFLRANEALSGASSQKDEQQWLAAWRGEAYCRGTDLLVPRRNACISSRVRRPSLSASIPLKIRS